MAEGVEIEHELRVPPDFFDTLIAGLDAAPVPNEPTRRAARRARELFGDG